jgi:hypothetical protein
VFREVFCRAKEKSLGPGKEEHSSPGTGTVEIVQHSRKQEKYVPNQRCNRSTRSLPPITLFAHGCVIVHSLSGYVDECEWEKSRKIMPVSHIWRMTYAI